jgi:hypothetical protein
MGRYHHPPIGILPTSSQREETPSQSALPFLQVRPIPFVVDSYRLTLTVPQVALHTTLEIRVLRLARMQADAAHLFQPAR